MSVLSEVPIPNNLNDHLCTCLIHISSTSFVILGSRQGFLLKFDSAELEIVHTQESGLSSIDSLCESSRFDEERTFWAGGSNSIILFDINFKEISRKEGHQDTVIGISELDSCLYSASEDNKVIEWNLENNDSKVLYEHNSPIITFDLNKEQRKIATACADMVLIVYSLENNEIIHRFDDIGEKIWSLKIFNDGIITGDNSGSVKFWNLDNNERTEINAEHESRVKSICHNENQRLFATCSFDSTVTIFDHQFIVLGRSKETEIRDWNRCSAFNDIGDKLYTLCDDKFIFEWTIEDPMNMGKDWYNGRGWYNGGLMNMAPNYYMNAKNLICNYATLPSLRW